MGSTKEYKCPNCGGSLTFNVDKQNIICEYCGAEFAVSDVKRYNEELEKQKEESFDWVDEPQDEYSKDELSKLNVYHCDSCGGEIVCDDNTSATSCPYCGSPIILTGRLEGGLKPDYIIPFKNNKESLIPVFNKYLKKKLFLPNVFKTANQIQETKGLYVPFWVHSADSVGRVTFKGEKRRTWSDGNYEYRETRYYSIIRDGSCGFDHIPVDGSKIMKDELMESIEPFDYSGVTDFDASYLSGFLSDKYDVTKEEAFPRANERIRQGTIDAFRSTVHGYSDVTLSSTSLGLRNTVVDYALFPVWIMSTKYKEKLYTFAMNGQTGKIVGNLPLSIFKYLISFFSFFIGLGVGSFLLIYLGIQADLWVALIFGLVFGLVPGLIFCGLNRRALKEVKFKKGAKEYLRKGSLNISYSDEIFLYKKVSRTKIQTSSK